VDKFYDIGMGNESEPKSTGSGSKNRQTGLHQAKKFLHSKENN
jgi:hypothetical protein